MIGLVIWCDSTENKAVFWCEDHGDLAYFTAESEGSIPELSFQPGDMVQFEMSCADKIRMAHNPELISRRTCNGIQDQLRKNAAQPRKAKAVKTPTGNVIQFPKQPIEHGYPLVS